MAKPPGMCLMQSCRWEVVLTGLETEKDSSPSPLLCTAVLGLEASGSVTSQSGGTFAQVSPVCLQP